MIRVYVKEPSPPEWPAVNAFVTALAAWKDWGEALGLTHMPGGSERSSLERRQWCIQSYSRRAERMFPGRYVCFHEDDRVYALIFKLTWGGQ
jgi:hypothetical protein